MSRPFSYLESPRPCLVLLCAVLLAVSPVHGDLAGDEPLANLAQRAESAIAAGDFDLAVELYSRWAQAAPLAAPAWLGLARAHESRGEVVKALAPGRRAIDLEPGNAVAQLIVGRLLARLGSLDPARTAFAEARRLDPQLEGAYLLPALLLRDEGRIGEAIELLDECLANNAAGADSREQLALLLLTAGQAERARSLVEPAAAKANDHAGLQRAWGLALAALPDRSQQAIAPLQRALDLGAETPGQIHLALGQLYLDKEEPSRAAAELRQAVVLLPQLPEAHYRLALALRALGETEAAAAALVRFQQLGREQEDSERAAKELGTAFNEAQSLATQNQLLEALAKAKEILAARPDHPETLALQGKVLFSIGRVAPALASLRRARQLDPGQVEYHYLEGLFLFRSGQPSEAAEALNRALALDPDLGEAHLLVGLASSKLARPEQAARHFARALELGVDGAELRLAYAYALESLGRDADSQAQLEAYHRLRQP